MFKNIDIIRETSCRGVFLKIYKIMFKTLYRIFPNKIKQTNIKKKIVIPYGLFKDKCDFTLDSLSHYNLEKFEIKFAEKNYFVKKKFYIF